jgi:endonuclease YncB( thermonuclease family)
MKKIIIRAVLAFFSATLVVAAASAQEAPAPSKAPRTPVSRQLLLESKAAPASHQVQGQAAIIDGERLRVDNTDLRLFGIVPPQLSASFGPQARSTLDSLTSSQPVTCQIHDRDHDGRMLAVCRTADNNDLALELLRRGLAVTARGSLSSSDLSAPYLAAEQAAQNQKIGLWSMAAPAPIAMPAKAEMPRPFEPAKTESGASPPIQDAKKEDSAAAKAKAASDKAVAAIAADTQTQQIEAVNASDLDPENALLLPTTGGFFARYQILITGLLMLLTALSILSVLTLQRRTEKRDELKAIAAALRGELMAARAVCITRIKAIISETDDKAILWPRIRSTLYQAYVGRLGSLGAELARQVASIYGQASDYAAYYNSTDDESATPKRQALQTLVNYIEEVLPRLVVIEQIGHLFVGHPMARSYAPLQAPPQTVTTIATPVGTEGVKKTTVSQPGAVIDGAAEEKVNAGTNATTRPRYTEAYAAAAAHTTPIWKVVRKFARGKLPDVKTEHAVEEIHDYTSLIEEDMANLSFGENGDDGDALHPPQAKRRKTGS